MHLASFVVAIDQNWMIDYAVLTAATRGMTALGCGFNRSTTAAIDPSLSSVQFLSALVMW
jgi:hypothetical protein